VAACSGSSPEAASPTAIPAADDLTAFCDSALTDVEATFVTDGMDDVAVLETMRLASRHYESAAEFAPADIKGEVLQVAANYLSLAEAMEDGKAPFQVLLSPPVEVDLAATQALGAYLDENCP
jgi:hypothetical protein